LNSLGARRLGEALMAKELLNEKCPRLKILRNALLPGILEMILLVMDSDIA
jgi:hypothetical protein